MKTAARLLVIALLLAALGTIVLDRRAISILKAENEGLRVTLQTHEATWQDVESSLKNLEAELSRLRAEAEQLPKLRGELMRLREASNDLERLQREQQRLAVENQQLRATPATVTEASANQLPTSGYVPRDKWAFMGYGTPAAAFQSSLWAASQGDVKSFLNAMVPEVRAQMLKSWGSKPEPEVAEEMKRDAQKFTGFQFLKSERGDSGAIKVTVFLDGENDTQKIEFRRFGEEWKMSP